LYGLAIPAVSLSTTGSSYRNRCASLGKPVIAETLTSL
jgi:hypothetical protein